MIEGAQAIALKQLVGIFLLPPNGLVTLAALGMLLALARPRWRRVGATLSLASLALLYLMMTATGSHWLVQRLESRAGKALDQPAMSALMAGSDAPQAIVILGGGARHDDREQPFTDNLEPRALERIRAGAWLARWSGLPVLTSGGRPRDTGRAEGELMARDLLADYGVPVRWVENRSRDTADNAAFSVSMLQAEGVAHILLVTHAFHMPRARMAFERAGLRVTPAPMGFLAGEGADVTPWLPRHKLDDRVWLAAHELIGSIWYNWRRAGNR